MALLLKQEVLKFQIDTSNKIPFIVKLLENPQSRLALPGNISLYNHDLLHVLLAQDLSLSGEAFVIGFSMGNDPDCRKIHILVYKFFSQYLYPQKYKFRQKHLVMFDWGYYYGRMLYKYVTSLNRAINKKPLNKLNLSQFEGEPSETVRAFLGIKKSDLYFVQQKAQKQIKILESKRKPKSRVPSTNFSKYLQFFGSICAIIGGLILASKTSVSGYGFILLAASSFQLLLSSILEKNLSLALYSGAVFFCVDLYGVYNWLLRQ
jgi:hypothetical protein